MQVNDMCLWNKMPKITIPSMIPAPLQRTAPGQQTNNTAPEPENAVYGGTKKWEVASKKKGVAALTVKKDTLNKATNDTGVNYNL